MNCEQCDIISAYLNVEAKGKDTYGLGPIPPTYAFSGGHVRTLGIFARSQRDFNISHILPESDLVWLESQSYHLERMLHPLTPFRKSPSLRVRHATTRV